MTNSKRILSIERSDLLKEWDYEKNSLICDPKNITIGSSRKVWWKCSKCGREWMATIGDRAIRNKGCSICSNIEGSKKRRLNILKKNGSLSTNNPGLLKEWDYSKNTIKPDEITSSSDKKVWWLCSKGHSYLMSTANKTNGKQGCPYCVSKKVLFGYNDLETTHPEVAKHWDYKNNYPVTPSDVLHASMKKYLWICPDCGETYEATVNSRTRKNNYCLCYSCSKKRGAFKKIQRITTEGNNLEKLYPELAKEWHPFRNTRKPSEVTPSSKTKAWWLCPKCGYEYKQSIQNRSKGQGCPYCAKAYQTSEPEQIIYFYVGKYFPDSINSYKAKWLGKSEIDIYIPSLNVAIEYDGARWHKDTSRDIKKTSLINNRGINLIRIREEGSTDIKDGSYVIKTKDYHSKVSNLNRPIIELLQYLKEKSKLDFKIDVNVERDCQNIVILFAQRTKEKSFGMIRPDLVKEWHPTFNKNLTPYNVSAGSHKQIWWKCSKCGHEWKTNPGSRYSKTKGTGCPDCGKNRVHESLKKRGLIKGKTDLMTLMPNLINEWNYEKNEITPDNYTISSNRKVWWKCGKGHEWQTTISSRTTRKKPTGCPYCSGSKVLTGFNDLKTVHPELAKEWDYVKNNLYTPENTSKGSNKKFWWICSDCGNSYQATISHRNRKRIDGTYSGCPNCKNIRTSKRMTKKS